MRNRRSHGLHGAGTEARLYPGEDPDRGARASAAGRRGRGVEIATRSVVGRRAVRPDEAAALDARDDVALELLEAVVARQLAVPLHGVLRIAQVGADAHVHGTIGVA